MAQSLDASVSSLMIFLTCCKVCCCYRGFSFSFCTTVLNSSGWNSFLTSCPLLPLWRITVVCTVQFKSLLVLCLLNSQIWRRLLTNTTCPQGKFSSHFSLFFGLVMLCLSVVFHHPCPQRSRETGNVFQSLKLNQTVSHICENFSNTFVAELAVVASVNLICLTLLGRSAHHSPHKEYCTRVVSSVLMSVYAQEEHCTWVVSSVLGILCPGCRCTPVHRFWQTFLIIITGKVIFIIFHLLLFKNLEQLVTLSWIVSKTEVICWLIHNFANMHDVALLQ
jgi:hypothetical protein